MDETLTGNLKMKANTKHLLKGFGSILDVYPKVDKYMISATSKTPNQRMDQAWGATGKQIRNAVSSYSNEQK